MRPVLALMLGVTAFAAAWASSPAPCPVRPVCRAGASAAPSASSAPLPLAEDVHPGGLARGQQARVQRLP